jgi:hypothetical protein
MSELDLDGQHRTFPMAGLTDIGADELVRSTTAGVSCSPTSLTLGSGSSNCTVTVTDPMGAPLASGVVNLGSSVAGSFAGPCVLNPAPPNDATCSVAFTPSAAGSHQITASYNGDIDHDGSVSMPALLAVAPAPAPPATSGGSTTRPSTPAATRCKKKKKKKRSATAAKKCKKKKKKK